jgi:hypothetical protein
MVMLRRLKSLEHFGCECLSIWEHDRGTPKQLRLRTDGLRGGFALRYCSGSFCRVLQWWLRAPENTFQFTNPQFPETTMLIEEESEQKRNQPKLSNTSSTNINESSI